VTPAELAVARQVRAILARGRTCTASDVESDAPPWVVAEWVRDEKHRYAALTALFKAQGMTRRRW
jgi:hypothetical protein